MEGLEVMDNAEAVVEAGINEINQARDNGMSADEYWRRRDEFEQKMEADPMLRAALAQSPWGCG